MTDVACHSDLISSPAADLDALRAVGQEFPCPYLPQRRSRNEAYFVERLDGALYERLLARGFRRSGHVVYRPRCRGCRECRQLRVPVETFVPSRSMRRVARTNADVRMEVDDPAPSDEKYCLFRDYLAFQHDGTMSAEYTAFIEFLYDSPIASREFSYYIGGRLVGVSIADRLPKGLSSVYMYFDPKYARRSLGTLSVLREIEWCRENDMPYYFLGFHVAGSRTMDYKARFRPFEILVADDRWIRTDQ